MSAAGTAISKKSVAAGSDGRTPAKAKVTRDEKLAAARAALAAKDAAGKALDAEQIADVVLTLKKAAKKIPDKLNMVPTPTAGKKATAKPTAKPAATAAPKATAPTGMKFCKFHNANHPVADFASNKAASDGRYYICREAEKVLRVAARDKKAAAAALTAA